MTGLTAEEVIHLLGLKPHPEGGFYRETFREAASTAIYFLLREGDVSAWHRMQNAAEAWHYYAGAPLELTTSTGRGRTVIRLGPDLAAGEVPQAIVPAGVWQTARLASGSPGSSGWILVGCTVAPAFKFTNFDMAPPGWEPGEDA
jgi:predicted cupin superfamily sugar epimerase